MNLDVKSLKTRRSSILFAKLSDAGLSDVLGESLIDTPTNDESLNVEQTLADLDFYYGLGKLLQLWLIKPSMSIFPYKYDDNIHKRI